MPKNIVIAQTLYRSQFPSLPVAAILQSKPDMVDKVRYIPSVDRDTQI